MKVFFRNIHLYLGLTVGLVVVITCFTGAVLVFEEELQHAFHQTRYYVQPGREKLPLQQLVHALRQRSPGAEITSVKIYHLNNRSVEINFNFPVTKTAHIKAKPAGPVPGRGQDNNRRTAYLHPYSGEVIEIYNYRDTFFYTMFDLHRWLLSGAVGKLIVGVCTLIFLFILVTGIILWWPKNKAILKQRLKIKWNAGWKRINHDFHIVLGFYSAIVLFVFAFTGLAWSFEWFNAGIYKITNSPQQAPMPPKSIMVPGTKPISLDEAFKFAGSNQQNIVFSNVNVPKDSTGAFSISTLSLDALHQSATNVVYLDQYNGQRLGQLSYNQRSLGARVRSTFKPVHTGAIFGLPSKIIAFIACLLGATFPITGTILWINRLRKKPSENKTGKKVKARERISSPMAN